MKNADVDKLIKKGATANSDKNNKQQRQLIAANGKLRIRVSKGNAQK